MYVQIAQTRADVETRGSTDATSCRTTLWTGREAAAAAHAARCSQDEPPSETLTEIKGEPVLVQKT